RSIVATSGGQCSRGRRANARGRRARNAARARRGSTTAPSSSPSLPVIVELRRSSRLGRIEVAPLHPAVVVRVAGIVFVPALVDGLLLAEGDERLHLQLCPGADLATLA